MRINDFFSLRPRISIMVALAVATACVGISACGDEGDRTGGIKVRAVRYGYLGPVDDRVDHRGVESLMEQFEILFGADTDVSDTFERQLKRRMVERSTLRMNVFWIPENDGKGLDYDPNPVFERNVNGTINGIVGESFSPLGIARPLFGAPRPTTMSTMAFEGCINRCPVSARKPVTFSTGATEISLGREFYVTPFRGFVVLWPKDGDGFIDGFLLKHAFPVEIPRDIDALMRWVISEPKLTNLADTAVP